MTSINKPITIDYEYKEFVIISYDYDKLSFIRGAYNVHRQHIAEKMQINVDDIRGNIKVNTDVTFDFIFGRIGIN